MTLSLAACVRGFALLGAIGGSLGVLFFGLAFGGALPRRVADYFFGPEDAAEK